MLTASPTWGHVGLTMDLHCLSFNTKKLNMVLHFNGKKVNGFLSLSYLLPCGQLQVLPELNEKTILQLRVCDCDGSDGKGIGSVGVWVLTPLLWVTRTRGARAL